jgi:hypothetical protein
MFYSELFYIEQYFLFSTAAMVNRFADKTPEAVNGV